VEEIEEEKDYSVARDWTWDTCS